MMSERDKIHNDILAMLAPSASQAMQSNVERIKAEDWDYILARGREHRFLPLMHWSLNESGVLNRVPDEIQKVLLDARGRSTLRSLSVQRDIVKVHRLLLSADVPHVFLKGAYLSEFVYPHSALRPLRDIDVVVDITCLAHAYQLLESEGYTPLSDNNIDFDAYTNQTKHLPGLISPSGKICIEVHSHVDKPDGKLAGLNALQNVIFKQLGGAKIPFMNPNELFIHLCVHAVDFHAFNNGPLIISDIGFLLSSGQIDLHSVASRASELGVIDSVALTLALVESCWQQKGNEIGAFFERVPEEVIEDARHLCLRSFDARSDVAFVAKLTGQGTRLNRIKILMEKVFPTIERMNLEFGKGGTQLNYAPRLIKRSFRILTRIRSIFESQQKQSLREEIERIKRLKLFLHKNN